MAFARRVKYQILQHALLLSQIAEVEILFDHGVLYPLSLLWMHTFTSLIVTLLTCWATQSIRRDESRYCSTVEPTPSLFGLRIVWYLATSLLEVSTNVFFMQGLFHARSITLPFFFYYLTDFLIQFINRSRRLRTISRTAYTSVIITLTASPFLVLIVLGERKLDPRNISILLLGAGSYIGKNILEMFLASKTQDADLKSSWTRPMTLFISLILTTLICLGVEEPIVFAYGGLQKLSASFHPILLIPSAVISILDVLESSSIGLQIEDRHQAKCSDICVDYAITKGVMDISIILILSFLMMLQTPTWIQIISYSTFILVASLGILGLDRQAHNTTGITPLAYDSKVEAEEIDMEEYTTLRESSNEGGRTDAWVGIRPKGGYHGWLAKLWVFGFGLVATKWFLELETHTRPRNIGQIDPQGQSGDTFRSSRGLDIVISYYNEDLYGLKAFVDSVGGVPKVRELRPRVIVYTKNQRSNISEIQSVIGTQEVIVLPNQGREGGTYLHHITNRWTDLANHTIFVQAEPHIPERIISRLAGYFDPTRTGMMDLGYRDLRGCSCLDCRDEFGWIDQANLIPELMANAHGISCDENTRVSLTYKGQFIVSAKRIRSVAKEIYDKINAELSGDNRIRLGGEEDSDDKPVLGYTLERSWGILFKCADMTGIQDRCPGLTTTSVAIGDLRPARPEDCGCLDD